MQSVLVLITLTAIAGAAVLAWLLVRERSHARELERYRRFFDDTDTAIVLFAPGSGLIVEANPAACAFYGRDRVEMLALHAWDIATAGERESRDRLAAAAEGPSVFTSLHRTKSGELRDVEVHAGPVGEDGSTLIFAAIQDVTPRRRSEIELEHYRRNLEALVQARTSELVMANRRLQMAGEAKAAFLANMSHELRTPLNSVIGFSGIMASGMAGPLSDEQAHQVAMISRSGKHLLALIEGLLDLSRIEEGRMNARMDEVELVDIARDALEAVQRLAHDKGLSLRGDFPSSRLVIRTDPLKVKQILVNLLDNAIKFTDAGEVGIEVDLDGDEVHFEVRDTGLGIPRDRQTLVFQEFRQLDVPGLAKPSGSGLGLTVAKAMAEMLGGRIELYSVVGEGSVFTLILPAERRSPIVV
ncbi:MAG: ATP-binding protein [Coriobacteriia bacterium]|nr:ATP-binding protein [Coriobacteriia bacterium]